MVRLLITSKNNAKMWKQIKSREILPRQHYKTMIKQAKKHDRFLTELILESENIPEDKTLNMLSEFFDMPVILLRNKVISPKVINLIPKEMAEQHSIVIFKKIKDIIHVATTTPENQQLVDFIEKKTGFKVVLFITTPKDIKHALKKYKFKINGDFANLLDLSLNKAMTDDASAENLAQFVPVIRMVDSIIERAIASSASDIHIESNIDEITIRFRIDGILHNIFKLPKSILPALVARVKILSNLKIDEHLKPQDGRFHFNYHDQEIAIRVSIIPTLHGPKVALRLLEMKQKMFSLPKLGLNKAHTSVLKNEIAIPQGMILVTGPTGSGKTTTLYTLLRMLNTEDVNICTIEDPVEYGIDNINQVQVKPHVGLTFANGLKSLLRQDPNVIMVGEIRDTETANIAVNSAMTGHLVLSTLHTNNAFSAPQRLVEIGVPPYLVNSVINVAVGQRLVRTLCKHCKIKLRSSEKLLAEFSPDLNITGTLKKLQQLGHMPSKTKISDIQFYRHRGCQKCNNTGYTGRVGIYEVIKVDDKLRKIILHDSSEGAVKDYLLKQDTLTMTEDGLLKVFNGHTTIDEVIRVTKG